MKNKMTKAQKAVYELIQKEHCYMDFFTGKFYSCITKKNIRTDVFFKMPKMKVYYKQNDNNDYFCFE